MESFGELLRAYRGSRGLTQEELAERSGLSADAISMLERGVRTVPRSSTVEVLAQVLQLDASERAGLVAAARGRGPLPARVPAGRESTPRPGPAMPTQARTRSPWALSVPGHWIRLAAAALAGLIALLVLGTTADHWLGARPAGQPPAHPTPAAPPPPPSAVVYLDAGNRTLLRRIGYDGNPIAGSWLTTDGPVLSTAGAPQQVVGVSPDGLYAVVLGPHRQNWQIIDPQSQVVMTVLETMDSSAFGTWASDSRHVCRLRVINPPGWQVAVTDLREPTGPGAVFSIGQLTYPPYVTIAACDTTARRAVLVEPLTDDVPAPPSAERVALAVDLSTGKILTRVPLGDSTHGVVFSLDGRYAATIDYVRGSSAIVDLLTGKTIAVEKGEARGFSADDSRVVVNSQFDPPVKALSTTRIVDWRTGRVLYSQRGWTNKVRAQPAGAALAMDVIRAVPNGPTDLVIVSPEGADTLVPNATLY